MLWILTLFNLLNYLDRYLLAALLPIISSDFGLNHEQGGYLVSAFVLGYVVASPIFGQLGDRFSRPPLMALGVVIWSIATALSGAVSGFAALFVARILVGLGEASFSTLAPSYIRDRSSTALDVNSKLGIFFTAIPVGSALGYALAGGVASVFPWQYAFYLGALPGLLLAGVLFKFTDQRIKSDKSYRLRPAVAKILSVPALRFAIGGYVLQAFALNGIATFITKLGVERGFTLTSITTIFGAILVATGLVGTFVGGRLSTAYAGKSEDPIRGFFKFLGLCTLAGVPFLVLAFYTENTTFFLICTALAELAIFAGTAPVNSIIVLAAPAGLSGLTQGITITALNLFGALLSPILVGMLADRYSLPMGLQLTSVALLLAGVTWFIGKPGMDAAVTNSNQGAV